MKKFFRSLVVVLIMLCGVSPNEVYATTDGVSITHTKDSITVDWSDKANKEHESGYEFTSYKAEVYTIDDLDNPLDSTSLDGSTTSFTFDNLKGGTVYTVKIRGDEYNVESEFVLDDTTVCSETLVTTPIKPTGVKQKRWWVWAEKCDVTWNKQNGCKFEILAKNSKGKTVAHIKDITTDYDGFEVKNNNVYTVKVRAYTSDTWSDAKETSAWSDITYCFTQPLIKGVSYTKKGSMQLSFNKINGADKYIVYMSTKEKKGYKKIKTLKGNFLTFSKLGKSKISKSKKYYVYVVAVKKVGGKTYTSGRHYTTTVQNQSLSVNWTFD